MNNDLIYYLTNNSGSLSVQEILMNFLAALVIGFVIYISYRISHTDTVYSAKFNASLWMLTVVTTLVMCVIGNNIALSLGMVGALSIVRFRTAINPAACLFRLCVRRLQAWSIPYINGRLVRAVCCPDKSEGLFQ